MIKTTKNPKQQQIQYFSKWRNIWVDFVTNPTYTEYKQLLKYNYNVKIKGGK